LFRVGAKGGQLPTLRRLGLPTSNDPYHQYTTKGATREVAKGAEASPSTKSKLRKNLNIG